MAYFWEGASEPTGYLDGDKVCPNSNAVNLLTDANECRQMKSNLESQSSQKMDPGPFKKNDNAFSKVESSNMFEQLESINVKKKGKRTNKNQKIPRYFCQICSRSYTSKYFKAKHAKEVHRNTKRKEIEAINKLSCNHCDEWFDDVNILTEHYKNVHKMHRGPYKSYFVHLKCLECELTFSTKNEFRNHLEDKHNLDMTPTTLKFNKMEAFLAWKSKIERETLTIFHSKAVRGSEGSAMRFECFRSGKNKLDKHKPPREQMNRQKANRLGVACSAEIYMEKNQEGVFVKYYPIHYGHGSEMRIAELSTEEQAAVDELTSKGMSFQKLINDLKGADYMDINHIYPIKKRYFSWVKNAFESEEYDSGFSDAECLSQWVQKCCQLEEVPILLCAQQDIGFKTEKFILIIMTEFQKQIFISSSNKIICVDTHNRASDPHLIVVSIMDELNTAFPVAYCITNKLSKEVMIEFFTCLKETIGNLSPKYLVSSYYSYIYESWIAVMGYNPVWLWSRSFLESVIRANFRQHLKKYPSLKCELYNIIQIMFDCRSEDIFVLIFKNFINKLENDKNTEKLAKWIMKWLGVNTDKWARCYQQEIDSATSLHLELLRHMFHACCRAGTKKKLFTLIMVIMKILRHKILDRILNSLDNSKLDLATNAINLCHNKGMTIPPNNICSLSDKLWSIETNDSEKVFVTQEVKKCPDYCCLKCHECNVCVHQFSCSCVHSIINANLCMHVHAVVFKVLGPFKDPASPANIECDSDTVLDNESVEMQTDVSIPTSPTFTSESQLSSLNNQVLHNLQCEINGVNDIQCEMNIPQDNIQCMINTSLNNIQCEINTPLNNSPSKIPANTVLNDLSSMTHLLTKCAPTALTFNSPSHINVPKSTTQTEISFSPSQMVTNLMQSNISNTDSSHFVVDISAFPKIVSGVPILKTESSSLISGTPEVSAMKNSKLLERILSQTTEIYQSVILGNLKKESLNKVMTHLNSCQKIIKSDQHSPSPVVPINPASVTTRQNKTSGSDTCLKKSSKRTSSLLDNGSKNNSWKTDNSMTDSPRVLVISNKTAHLERNNLKDS